MCRSPVRPRGTTGTSRLFDAGGCFDRIVWPHTVSQPRTYESLRLPISLYGTRAAILYFGRHRDKPGVGYTCSLQAMSCVSRALPDLHPAATRAAKHMQPHTTTTPGHEGGRGGSSKLSLNIYLSLSPLANSPLGRRDKQMPPALCARGSMTLRRAKAASYYKRILY